VKRIHVACAIIEKGGKVLCAQRSESMSLPLKWEFPGGKIDVGESPEECLRRELVEEMDIYVRVGKSLPQSTYHYPSFTVTLYPFICLIESGDILLREHADIAWLPPEQLNTLDWAKADLPVIKSYRDACECAS
jgi:8-oxo-dGTP diphosphatase